MTARARLDADRTAEPLTRIEHHPPHGGCISPYMPLTPSEVALAKILAAVEEYDATASPWRNVDAKVYAGLDYAADGLCAAGLRAASYLTPQGRALLARARKAGVL